MTYLCQKTSLSLINQEICRKEVNYDPGIFKEKKVDNSPFLSLLFPQNPFYENSGSQSFTDKLFQTYLNPKPHPTSRYKEVTEYAQIARGRKD